VKNNTKMFCPNCRKGLTTAPDNIFHCAGCNATYPVQDGIPILLPNMESVDKEQDLMIEKEFYENMFSDVQGFDDGHCIVYGHERIYDFMEGVEKGSVLEVGCGGGHHSVNLSKRGFQVTSIDISLNALHAAKKLAKHEGQDIQFICGDIKRLPFADKEFDICFCSLILHHFKSLDNILKELSRVTKKQFIAFEVNALDPISYLRFNVMNPLFGVKNISKNQRALLPGELSRILASNGFKDIKIKYEDIHDNLGKSPDSRKAKMIMAYQKFMKLFPEKYSQNKFLLKATR
jgi:ubiquinone/menaquinone biosynthesis C-methylase UbiE